MSPFDATQSWEATRRHLATLLSASGIESAATDARLLMMAALDTDHAGLIANAERPLGTAAGRLGELAVRRMRREPVSRILGRREFYGLEFVVTPAVLDPRPDTECLVDAALGAIAETDAPWRVLDLGVGSGAVLAALLQARPKAWGIGVDRSEAACRVAAMNLARLGLHQRGAVVCGSWAATLRATFDIVVSNPPYIRAGEMEGLHPEVRDHDPPLALNGGEDGLAAVRDVIDAARHSLRPGGWVGIEIGRGQAGAAAALLAGAGFLMPQTERDLAGTERIVFTRSPATAAVAN